MIDEAAQGVATHAVGNVRRLDRQLRHLDAEDAEGGEAIDRRVIGAPHGKLEFFAQLIEGPAIHRLYSVLERVIAVQLLVHHGNPPVAVGIRQPPVDLAADRIHDAARRVGQLAE